MSADNLALQAIAELGTEAGRRKAAKAKEVWSPLDFNRLRDGRYVACDPSLGATGIVMVRIIEHSPMVVFSATVASTYGTSGWENVLQSAAELQERLSRWLITNVWDDIPWLAVHEAPPTGGGKFLKPELSLIAGYAFRRAVDHSGNGSMLPMVRPQDHKRLICGNANADKKTHHKALKELFPRISGAAEMVTNEGQRDALSIALTAATRP